MQPSNLVTMDRALSLAHFLDDIVLQELLIFFLLDHFSDYRDQLVNLSEGLKRDIHLRLPYQFSYKDCLPYCCDSTTETNATVSFCNGYFDCPDQHKIAPELLLSSVNFELSSFTDLDFLEDWLRENSSNKKFNKKIEVEGDFYRTILRACDYNSLPSDFISYELVSFKDDTRHGPRLVWSAPEVKLSGETTNLSADSQSAANQVLAKQLLIRELYYEGKLIGRDFTPYKIELAAVNTDIDNIIDKFASAKNGQGLIGKQHFKRRFKMEE